MNTEIQKIIASMEDTLNGGPWFGKSIKTLLSEVNPEVVYKKFNDNSHSIIDLLYHMITWVEFAQHRLEKSSLMNNNDLETLDWRETNTSLNSWNNGLSQFDAANNKILQLLKSADDELLKEKVDFREYDFDHLLNGLIQHNIYHIGQIAYANKLLS